MKWSETFQQFYNFTRSVCTSSLIDLNSSKLIFIQFPCKLVTLSNGNRIGKSIENVLLVMELFLKLSIEPLHLPIVI